MTTVYRATPLGQGYDVSVFVEAGEVIAADREYVVRTRGGDLVPLLGWYPSRSEAWAAAGDEIDHLSRHLAEQAKGCRMRAWEEVPNK